MVFHILETAGSGKITSQNDHKNGFYTGWSKICIHLRQLEVPKKYIFLFFFFDFIWWKFYISRCC